MELSQEQLKERLHYNPLTGNFTWIQHVRTSLLNTISGCFTSGYIAIQIAGKRYKAHRLAFLYMTGTFPSEVVDHKDCNPINNRWDNLRSCSSSENQHNRLLSINNTSGTKGVCFHKKYKMWNVQLNVKGKRLYLGSFVDFELAELVVTEAREFYHGAYARHL